MRRTLLIVTEDAALGALLQDRFAAAGLSVLVSPLALAERRVALWGRPDAILWDAQAAGAEGAAPLRRGHHPPPALIVLEPPGAAEGASPGAPFGAHPGAPSGAGGEADARVRRPVEFEDLAEVVEHRLTEPLQAEEARQLTASAIQPLAAEVAAAPAEGARAPRAQGQGVRVLSLDLAGACFDSPVDFRAGTAIALSLPVPGEARPARLKAEVRWCQRKGARALVGCYFEIVTPEDLLRLEKILLAGRRA